MSKVSSKSLSALYVHHLLNRGGCCWVLQTELCSLCGKFYVVEMYIRLFAASYQAFWGGQVDQEQEPHLLGLARVSMEGGVQQAEHRAATLACSHSKRPVKLASAPCKGRAT